MANITGTSASCKIKNVKVSKAKAYLNVIISSTSPAEVNKYYRFYILQDNVLSLLSSNNYWIDRNNNYNNQNNNVDINMYKEIVLEVDLTNGNEGTMKDLRWVRRCQLVLVDEDANKQIVWYSGDMDLVSEEIEMPQISEFDVYSSDDFQKLHIMLKYKYGSQADFNYNNSNLFTRITLKSNATQKVLDTVDILEEDPLTSTISYIFEDIYDDYIDILVELCNMAGTPLVVYKKLYKPYIRRFKTYIKVNGKVKRVDTIHVSRPETIALHGMDIRISPVEIPTLRKLTNLVYEVERNDIEENLPYHFVEVYVRGIYFTTVQDEQFSLFEFEEFIPEDESDPLEIKLKSFRLIGTYKKYSDTEITIYDYNKNCGINEICGEENYVRF